MAHALRRLFRAADPMAACAVIVAIFLSSGVAGEARAAEPVPLEPLKVIAMLRASQFDELERLMTGIQKDYERGLGTESRVRQAFYCFQSSPPDLQRKLRRWIRAKPRSFAARMARAIYYRHKGWMARQSARINRTPLEQLRGMQSSFEQAERDLQGALELNPKLTIAHAVRFEMFAAAGKRDLARKAYMRGLNEVPDSFLIHDHYLWGLQPQWGGSISLMKAYVAEVLRKYPSNPELKNLSTFVFVAEARGYRRSKRYDAGIDLLSTAIATAPSGSLYWERGRIHHRMRQYGKAIEDYRIALKTKPQEISLLDDLAESYRRVRKFDEAMAVLDLALKIEPFYTYALDQRATIFIARKKYNEARLDRENALVFGGFKAYYWAQAGDIYYYYLRDFSKAAAYFKRATELNPRFAFFWYKYSHALWLLKDCDTEEPLIRYLSLCMIGGGDCSWQYFRIAGSVYLGMLFKGACSSDPAIKVSIWRFFDALYWAVKPRFQPIRDFFTLVVEEFRILMGSERAKPKPDDTAA